MSKPPFPKNQIKSRNNIEQSEHCDDADARRVKVVDECGNPINENNPLPVISGDGNTTVDFVDPLKMNDRLKVDVIGTLNLAATGAIAYFNQITEQTGIDDTGVVLVLDNSAINTNPAIIDGTTIPGEFTFAASGNYEFELQFTGDTEDNARRTSKTTLQKFDGTNWNDLPPTQGSPSCYGYHRNRASGENTVYNRIIVTAETNARFRFVTRSLNSGLIRTVPDGTSLVIRQV